MSSQPLQHNGTDLVMTAILKPGQGLLPSYDTGWAQKD